MPFLWNFLFGRKKNLGGYSKKTMTTWLLLLAATLLLLPPTASSVPPFKVPRKNNIEGNLFVDESCINCDICRWMCPSVYKKHSVGAIVYHQPVSEEEKIQAYSALVTCPTGSIRLHTNDPLIKQVHEAFPAIIDDECIPNVHHVGYSNPAAKGSTSYFITTKNGNIMIDPPRYSKLLDQNIQLLGGLDTLIITNRNNVYGHEKWKEKYPKLSRIIHKTDATLDADGVEIKLEGTGIWHPQDDLKIIHTPGNTAGALCVLYETGRENVLFSGHHLAYLESKKGLDGFKRYNEGNIEVQSMSIRQLVKLDELKFTWILPSHGRMIRFKSDEDRKKAILAAADEFDAEDETTGMLGIGYY